MLGYHIKKCVLEKHLFLVPDNKSEFFLLRPATNLCYTIFFFFHMNFGVKMISLKKLVFHTKKYNLVQEKSIISLCMLFFFKILFYMARWIIAGSNFRENINISLFYLIMISFILNDKTLKQKYFNISDTYLSLYIYTLNYIYLPHHNIV